MTHLPVSELNDRLKEAHGLVEVGAEYRHYKTPESRYRILLIGFTEATDEPCVIYQANYQGKQLVFVRPLSNFIETVEVNSEQVARFQKLTS